MPNIPPPGSQPPPPRRETGAASGPPRDGAVPVQRPEYPAVTAKPPILKPAAGEQPAPKPEVGDRSAVPAPPKPAAQKGKEEPKLALRKRERAKVGCLSGMLYFLVIISLSVFLAVFAWGCVNDVLALMKSDGEAEITVPENYTIPELSRQLKEAGVIEQSWLFTLYCDFSNATDIIDPGVYTLQTNLDYRAVVHEMIKKPPERTTVRIKFVEGLTQDQVIQLLIDNGVSTRSELEAAIENTEFPYSFLEGIPEGPKRLEGFLYPDTYDFYQGGSAKSVIDKFLANFELKYTETMRKRVENMDYTLHEVLTIAAMIQMEAAGASDMKDISSVIYNRLSSPDFPRLDIDATVQYLLPERKEHLTAEDLAIDSPYNTRKYPGLPPGPICAPSIESIRAALYPSKTNFYYYCMTDAGVHQFCRTAAEFEKIKNANPNTYPR